MNVKLKSEGIRRQLADLITNRIDDKKYNPAAITRGADCAPSTLRTLVEGTKDIKVCTLLDIAAQMGLHIYISDKRA